MTQARRKAQPREVRRTLLIVGEGLAEETFLRHLKRVYAERGRQAITIKNAKGKGGGHVLDYSSGQRKAADYDQVAALLDTDADWNDERRVLAQRRRILVFEASPCLEALLLDISGLKAPAATAACKRAFKQHFGQEAHAERVYTQHLTREVLDAARQRVEVLDRLIHLLST